MRTADSDDDPRVWALCSLIASGESYRQAVADRFDLHVVDLTALGMLGRSPQPLTPQNLATRLGTGSGTVTAVVDRLAAAGLVFRGPHPSDRRARLISVTAQGRAVLAFANDHLTRALDGVRWFAQTPPGQLGETLHGLAERLERTAGAVRSDTRRDTR
ncbi:MAG: MarR family winged helix-turn-helix transcriptional regulator [Jatrophihabitantaceae bacterium]